MNIKILPQEQCSFKSERRFYDDKNYPRGMNRSGDYTLNEVQLLEQYGIALQALATGQRLPINEEEQQFQNVCSGKVLASTKIEKTWLKYQNKILSPKQFHTLFGRTKVQSTVEVADDNNDDLNTD